MYVKRPTKQELYDRIAELERIQRREYEERNREKLKKWNDAIPLAFAECRKHLGKVFPHVLTLLRFEHVDEGGYWFTFQLTNDERRQTYCIRHHEIKPQEEKTK